MKYLLCIVAVMIVAACSHTSGAYCTKKKVGVLYSFSYDACRLAIEEYHQATDFDVNIFKLNDASKKQILMIYRGGAPEVSEFYKRSSQIKYTNLNELKAEVIQTADDVKNSYGYEAIIYLPENDEGPRYYLHIKYDNLTRSEAAFATSIIESIHSIKVR